MKRSLPKVKPVKLSAEQVDMLGNMMMGFGHTVGQLYRDGRIPADLYKVLTNCLESGFRTLGYNLEEICNLIIVGSPKPTLIN